MHLNSIPTLAVVAVASLIIGPLLAADDPPANQDPASSTARNPATNPAPAGPATTPSSSEAQPGAEAEPGAIESSIYSSLFMAGKTQDHFHPFTAKERLKIYTKDLISPFHFILAGAQAGITQWQDSPSEWGQGAAGYGRRYANYYAYQTTSQYMQMVLEDILHEDNYYYGSGYHGFWRRTKYAVKSSWLARGADGTQHFSVSQIASTAGAAYVSRLWQPGPRDIAVDGAKSFGLALASNAGVNVLREFLPDVYHHVFRRGEGNQR
jgi:hypothetical protein